MHPRRSGLLPGQRGRPPGRRRTSRSRPRPAPAGPPGRRPRRRRAARSVRAHRSPIGGVWARSSPRASRVSSQLDKTSRPASPDFSGWNWVADSGAVLDRGDERLAVLGHRDLAASAAAGPRRLQSAARRSARSRTACPASSPRTAPSRRATSTVFQPMCGSTGASSRSTVPGQTPQPSVRSAVLDTRREQHLHADADAEHRAAQLDPARDQLVPADARAAPPCRRRRRRRPGRPGRRSPAPRPGRRSRDVGARPGQRPLGGPQVARSVVEDDDPGESSGRLGWKPRHRSG